MFESCCSRPPIYSGKVTHVTKLGTKGHLTNLKRTVMLMAVKVSLEIVLPELFSFTHFVLTEADKNLTFQA